MHAPSTSGLGPSTPRCTPLRSSDGIQGGRGAPQATPIDRMMFSFEKSKPSTESVRALIYEEVLNYHPAIKAEYEKGSAGVHPSFKYPRCAVLCLLLVGKFSSLARSLC